MDNLERPKKELSEAKKAALLKMKAGREAWLKEKARCKAEGLPPPVSKKKKKVKVEDPPIQMVIEDAEELFDHTEGEAIDEQEEEEEVVEQVVEQPKKMIKPKRKKKKQVVINNYYEEVESSSEEEEVVNNHYRTYSNNPNPQYQEYQPQQKIIRFV